jgi:hypothetical protein
MAVAEAISGTAVKARGLNTLNLNILSVRLERGAPGLKLSVSRHGLFTDNLNNRNYLGPAISSE